MTNVREPLQSGVAPPINSIQIFAGNAEAALNTRPDTHTHLRGKVNLAHHVTTQKKHPQVQERLGRILGIIDRFASVPTASSSYESRV